jgi:ABC-2 type transport system ATP-binding protein
MSPASSRRPPAPEPLVAAERLARIFPGARGRGPVEALVDVSFRVEVNEVLGVVGANGAGKTTLLDILATTLSPTHGTARIGGFDICGATRAARRLIGHVPAGGRALYPRLTVRQNLKFFAALYGLTGGHADARIAELLQVCDAGAVERVRVDRVSDGMAARVALARAMLHDPMLLLLDEPERSIDPVRRLVLLDVIRRYADRPGRGAIIVTHSLGDPLDICDRVVVLREGRLVQAVDVDVTRGARGRELISRAIAGEVPA